MAAPVDVNELGFTVLHEASHPKVECVTSAWYCGTLYLRGVFFSDSQQHRLHPRVYGAPSEHLGCKGQEGQEAGAEAWKT